MFISLIYALFLLFMDHRAFSLKRSSSKHMSFRLRTNKKLFEDYDYVLKNAKSYNKKIFQKLVLSTSVLLVSLSSGIPKAKASIELSQPQVTHKIFLDIKIANYTEESVGTNKGATGSGRLVIGLYGKDSPESVKNFLCTLDGNGLDRPNFIRSQFSRVQDDVLLEVEKVKGINKINIGGADAFEYQGNILADYKPILETNNLLHDKKGLLTRRQLYDGPEFGITLGAATSLDGFHVVFGRVLEGLDVIDALAAIPKYTYKAASGYVGTGSDGVADKWFESQRKFYVSLGQSLGDTRAVDLRGRLLRRVLIQGSGRLD